MHRNIFEFADLFSFSSFLLKPFYVFQNFNIIYITYFIINYIFQLNHF